MMMPSQPAMSMLPPQWATTPHGHKRAHTKRHHMNYVANRVLEEALSRDFLADGTSDYPRCYTGQTTISKFFISKTVMFALKIVRPPTVTPRGKIKFTVSMWC